MPQQLIMDFDVSTLVGNLVDNLSKSHKATVAKTTKVVTGIVEKMLSREKTDTEKLNQIYDGCIEYIKKYKNKHKKMSEDCLGVLKLDGNSIKYVNEISHTTVFFQFSNGRPWISYHEYPNPPYSVDVDEDDLTFWIKVEIEDAKRQKAQRSFNLM